MHPLHNGSQATVRPPKKPLSGAAGWFTESGDNNIPSYPGADWFNNVIAEFINSLEVMGVDFDPTKDDHLAKSFEHLLTRLADLSKGVVWATPAMYGASTEDLDSADELKALLAAEKYVMIDKKYNCSACLRPSSDQTILFSPSGEIKSVPAAGGGLSDGYGDLPGTIYAQILFANVSNVALINARLDGNSAAFGGRIITGDAGPKPHGIIVLSNCENITVIMPRAVNVPNFAYIHLSNGTLGQSKNILFDKPTANAVGGGVGVEILYAGEPDVSGLYGASPGRTVINDANITDAYFPAYYAGGEDIEVNGGYFQSSRNESLTLYTGDAHGALFAKITGGIYDSSFVTSVTPPHPLLARSVNLAPENEIYYKKAATLRAVLSNVTFKNVVAGLPSTIFDNCEITLNDVEFLSSNLIIAPEFFDAVGIVTKPLKISGQVKEFSGVGVVAYWDIKASNLEFESSISGNNDCMQLASASVVANLSNISFGINGSPGSTIRHGLVFDNPNIITAMGLSFSGSGAQYSATEVNSYNLTSISSSPPSLFDLMPVRQRAVIPSHIPTGEQPRMVWNSGAVSGEPTYWYFNGATWVGLGILP